MPGTDPIRVVDLFCGGGGLSWGLVEALKEAAIEAPQPTQEILEERIDLVGLNHDEQAIETHQANHPWARHYNDDIENVKPHELFDDPDPDVKVLSGGIECTHWSTARGGKPVQEQKRMPAWAFIHFVHRLKPAHVLVENVPAFEDWGPIKDGGPTRNGESFDAWIDALHSHGYSVEWRVLNAADYGDPTSRERLFIMATREGTPAFPEPTHSDEDDELPDHRTAADIIDWEDLGGSIFSRDLHDPRKQPLANSTLERIGEGIRRHCADELEPYAEEIEDIGPDDVRAMRDRAVPLAYADTAAAVLDSPFLVHMPGGDETPVSPDSARSVARRTRFLLGQHSKSIARSVTERQVPTITTDGNIHSVTPRSFRVKYYGTSPPQPITDPLDTITSDGNHHALANTQSILLRQWDGDGAFPVDVTEGTVPTVAKKGAHSLATSSATPLVMPRNGYHRGKHSNPLYEPDSRPLHTVTAQNTDGYLTTPSLVHYSHGGRVLEADDPMPTIATERAGAFGLTAPYLCPLYNGRSGQRPRTRDVDRPLMTVPASKSPAGISQPFLCDYHGNSDSAAIDEPLGAVETKDRYALVIPELWPFGFDVKYRMLKPEELARAQGFPEDYKFTGTKTERTAQIGNAVPVTTAQRLFESLLGDGAPSLDDFLSPGDNQTPGVSTRSDQSSPSDD